MKGVLVRLALIKNPRENGALYLDSSSKSKVSWVFPDGETFYIPPSRVRWAIQHTEKPTRTKELFVNLGLLRK